MIEQTNLFNPPENTVKLVSLKMVKEDFTVYQSSISSSNDVIDLVKPIYNGAWREIVVIICLNSNNTPTAVSTVNIGGLNSSLASPANVFKIALSSNSAAIILVHNHPSGTNSPSDADIKLTNKIKEGGKIFEIDLLDHLIIAGPECNDSYSFRSHDLI